jgi:dTDP-D-glucose 4,6-dehydratase
MINYNKTILIIGGKFIAINLIDLLLNSNDRIITTDLEIHNHEIICENNDINELIKKYDVDIIINFNDSLQKYDVSRYLHITTNDSNAHTRIRLSNCYGPQQDSHALIPRMILRAIQQTDIVISLSETLKDFIFISDCCDAIYKILNFGFEKSYDICSGQLIKDVEIAKMILTHFELPLSFIDYINEWMPIDQLNNKKIIDLGWHPKICFEDGLNKTIQWFKTNNLLKK